MSALLLLALLLIFFPRLQRQRRTEIRLSTSANITTSFFRRHAFKLLSSPILIMKDGLAWCFGLVTGSTRKSEEEIRAQAGHAREELDKALEKDAPFEARRALERLVRLKGGRVPVWLGEVVGPLKEEWGEVEEREEHRQQLVGELEEAIARCKETLERIKEDEDGSEEWSSKSSLSLSPSSSSTALAIPRRTVSVSSSSHSSHALSSSSTLLWADIDDQEVRLVAALERAKETLATAEAGTAVATAADANLNKAPAKGGGGGGEGGRGGVSTLWSSVQRGERILKLWQRGKDEAAEVELAHHYGHAMNPPPPSMPAIPAPGAAGGGGSGGGRIACSSSSSSNTHSRKLSFVVVEELAEGWMDEGVKENNVSFPPEVDEAKASVGETETGPRGGMVEKVGEGEEEGKEGWEVCESESIGRSPEGEGGESQEDRASTNSISSSASSAMVVSNDRELTAATATVSVEGRMLVHRHHHHHHQQQALIMGAFTQSVQQELRRQTTAARVIRLEGMLEKRRQYRARQKREEGRAAKQEQCGRKETLRQRGRELVEVRRRHQIECGKADESRRLKDQALFTYLLPVSMAVFGVVVYLASLSEESRGGEGAGMLLIEALWHVPFHDLLYGDCKARPQSLPSTSLTAPKIKVVHHNVKGIPGAAHSLSSSSSHFASSGLQLLNVLVGYVVPEGMDLGLTGAFGMTGCYVKRTLTLVANMGLMVLLHYLMGELGLGQHRAKLHVGMLLYCCREAFVRLTWRSLFSVRCVLGFHGLLWVMTAWKDEGHAFQYRHILFHRVVPLIALGVGVWDATRQVDPREALESFRLLAKQIVN
ncbi:hypothetical protein VYU27_002079 [Nannochloropsis oceanica]